MQYKDRAKNLIRDMGVANRERSLVVKDGSKNRCALLYQTMIKLFCCAVDSTMTRRCGHPATASANWGMLHGATVSQPQKMTI